MDTLSVLTDLLHLEIGSRLPVEIPHFRRVDLAVIFAKLGYARGAEIGVEHGVFSEVLCRANPKLHLLCIDPWRAYVGYRDHTDPAELEACYQESIARLKPYNTEIWRMAGAEAAEHVADNSLDFVYIDGNHELPFIINDIIAWTPKVRAGGIVAGHDYYESTRHDSKNHVLPAVQCYTRAYKIRPWFVLGARDEAPDIEGGEPRQRDKMRSWMWVK